MRLAREGWREMLTATVVLGGGVVAACWLGWWPVAVPLVLLWGWAISFFRDPARTIACASGELCSPADGTVTEISRVEHDEHIDAPAIRIGIFLSVFNVHINRSPCAASIRSIHYKIGKFLDARNPEAGRLNESNTLLLEPDAPCRGLMAVRQVSGALARRIVCHPQEGEHMEAGERFGLIKFGSRTELIMPDDGGVEVLAKIGEKVKAGETILARQIALGKRGVRDGCEAQTSPVG